jgi:TonB family protein
MSTATQIRKKWQGQKIEGRFLLGRALGGSEQSAVFLTELIGREPRQAAIKIIPAAGGGDEVQLARWASAARLDHPHLLRVFESGRCELDGASYLYVVMEYAEEDLSQILPQRPLSPAEASAMLQPTVEVISYLHQVGFVHGRIKPSNILAVDDQLKISSDGLFQTGEKVGTRQLNLYDAPEISTAGLSTAADMWSLGVTLVATLTQYPPNFTNSTPAQLIVPERVPEPFREIARRCLMVDPTRRATVAEIRTRLHPQESSDPGKVGQQTKAEHRRSGKVLPALIVIVLLALLGTWVFLARRPPFPPADHPAPPASSIAAKAPSPALPEPQHQTKETVHSQVSQPDIPNVPQSARDTITGRIRVNVQVSVDPSGKVSEAKLTSHVESKYFARVALASARRWSFAPAQVDGGAVASEWALRFLFGRAGTQVVPTEIRP